MTFDLVICFQCNLYGFSVSCFRRTSHTVVWGSCSSRLAWCVDSCGFHVKASLILLTLSSDTRGSPALFSFNHRTTLQTDGTNSRCPFKCVDLYQNICRSAIVTEFVFASSSIHFVQVACHFLAIALLTEHTSEFICATSTDVNFESFALCGCLTCFSIIDSSFFVISMPICYIHLESPTIVSSVIISPNSYSCMVSSVIIYLISYWLYSNHCYHVSSFLLIYN